ncbi:glycosyltransferase family 39 protein [Spongiactinospora sp. TRM90649]|uniref:glycosyltransferase family 39 protein n=1 Tax=Spongiactinospora sp. TRM90649 TaxID=3031114 RepID=UPI0023F6665F|nr:glycosyltransferase family 39 protein [Spongiactinospora sp. TRM90649]MDF5752314.1 glycosyltransferase family 39 protein [Spongiactinospora sp. TRM90649]
MTTTATGQAASRVRGRSRRLLSRWPLAAVLLLAAVLYTWGLSRNGHANAYYAAAVLSGTESWKAFFFGALDAGSYITVDKPPFALWVMGLSARVFGMSPWSLLLPQAAAGVATVWLVHSAVRRSVPGRPGLVAAHVAALVLALTPITVAINRDDNPDPIMVLLLTGAAWLCLAGLRDGRLRYPVLAAVLVGLAFNTKMLQAYLVLPALGGVYLFAAPGTLRRRFGALGASALALVVSSGWWMTVVDLWPKGDRPYVGGSGDNSVWDLVVGYNGLGRFLGQERDSGGGPDFGGQAGLWRLFNEQVAGQISWLLPFAVIALIAGLVLPARVPAAGFRYDGPPRSEPVRAALLLWGGWLVVHYVVFSLSGGIFHPYYTTALAPAIAALCGIGGVLVFRAYRCSPVWAWLTPLSVAVTGAWSFTILRRAPQFAPWAAWVVAGLCAVAVAGLAWGAATRPARSRLAGLALAAGVAGGLTGPAVYAVTPLGAPIVGTNPTAGPKGKAIAGLPPGAPGGPGDGARGAPGGGGFGGEVPAGLVAYLVRNQGGATWLAAFGSAQPVVSLILSTGRPAMAMGGFLGSDPATTVAALRAHVAAGRVRYVVPGGGLSSAARGDQGVTQWVEANCALVPPSDYGVASSNEAVGRTPEGRRGDGRRVYRCS